MLSSVSPSVGLPPPFDGVSPCFSLWRVGLKVDVGPCVMQSPARRHLAVGRSVGAGAIFGHVGLSVGAGAGAAVLITWRMLGAGDGLRSVEGAGVGTGVGVPEGSGVGTGVGVGVGPSLGVAVGAGVGAAAAVEARGASLSVILVIRV